MSCPEELELFLLREGSDELGEGRAREVADHLASCAECQAKVAELQALGEALARPDPLAENARAAFVASVVKKLDAREPAPAAAPGTSRLWSVGLPIAAAACCAVVVVVAVPVFFLTAGRDSAPMAMQEAAQAAPPTLAMADEEAAEPFASGAVAPSAPEAQGLARNQQQESRGGGGAPGGAPPPSPVAPAPLLGALPAAPPMPAEAPSARSFEGDGRFGSGAPADEASSGGRRDRLAAKSAPRPQLGAVGGRNESGWVQPGQAPMATLTPGAAVAPRPVSIDPHGRFATTYRPGRGHLARFERTMLQGQVPDPAIELVAAEGHGRGPAIPAPAGRALALDVRSGLGQLPPDGGPVHLALTLRSTAEEPTTRPQVAVHLVMDTSGSMSGSAMEHARQAALRLVSLLQAEDRFSLVSYNSSAAVVVSEGPVGPRRTEILRQIESLAAGGGTNLEDGLRLGYAQAQGSRSVEDAVQLAIVLSDGQPNQGVTDPWQLSEMSAAAFQSGVETTSIGVGDSYEPLVMSTIAEYGAGGYYYLPDASTIDQVLQAELDVRTHPVARGVELRVRLAPGVELLEAYGSRRLNEAEAQRVRAAEVAIDHQEAHRTGIARDRDEDIESGMRFFIPGFARDDQHTILLRLRAPAGTGDALLANVVLRYKDRLTNSNQDEERELRVPFAQDAATARASADPDVRRAVYGFRTGQALVDVSAQLATGHQDAALATLYERVEMLRRAAESMNDATLRADAERLDGFRRVVAARTMAGNHLMMGSILQRAGNGFMR